MYKVLGSLRYLVLLAETEGFEPSEPVTARLVSSEVLSTTQPRLHTYTMYMCALLYHSTQTFSTSRIILCYYGPNR